MKKMLLAATVAVSSLTAATGASAADTIVYKSLTDDSNSALTFEIPNSYSSSYRVYNRFALAQNATISAISMLVAGAKPSPTTGVFNVYASEDTTVGISLYQMDFTRGAVTPANDLYGLDLGSFTINPANLSLTAGTYFLSFAGPDEGGPFQIPTFTNSASASNYTYQSFNGPITGAANFTIFSAAGAVPEPATWAMMMMGFGMMGFAMRRRSKPSVRVTYA